MNCFPQEARTTSAMLFAHQTCLHLDFLKPFSVASVNCPPPFAIIIHMKQPAFSETVLLKNQHSINNITFLQL